MNWYLENGKESDVIVSSRIRLARNLQELPFKAKMTKEDNDKFNFIDYSGNKYCKWWNYGYDTYGTKPDKDYSDVYIDDLKCIAAYQGYSPEDIDTMLESGISPDEIEEYLYCWE